MTPKEEFLEIFQTHIHREGSAELLDYLLNKSDFFTAPASARFHGSYVGGLCEHSVNVFRCLEDYLARPRTREVYQVVLLLAAVWTGGAVSWGASADAGSSWAAGLSSSGFTPAAATMVLGLAEDSREAASGIWV